VPPSPMRPVSCLHYSSCAAELDPITNVDLPAKNGAGRHHLAVYEYSLDSQDPPINDHSVTYTVLPLAGNPVTVALRIEP
jgi:hypothetical protein